jgi:hypothetical protein
MSMSDARLDVRVLAAEWLKDPAFRAEYDALEEEFSLAAALMRALSGASMTQEQLAAAMGTKLRIGF